MNEPATNPLDRLIAALARKAVAEHLAQAAQPRDRERDASTRDDSTRRTAA
jgi:hypothetical protein